MNSSLLLAASVFALVASGTPGPNNLMLAASGLNHGFRRTVPLLLGIETGFLLLLLAVALGLGALFEQFPLMKLVLKAFGVAYLLHLAYKLWRSSGSNGQSGVKPLGFVQGAAFQVINPKAWMMVVSATSAYTLSGEDYWASVWTLVLIFLLIGLPSITAWAAFGAGLRTVLEDPRKAKLIGRGMSVLTALSCLLILW